MRPVLIVNPRDDDAFVRRARAAAIDVADAASLAQRLQAWYPDVVVRPRELSSEPTVMWYVYRDGRWTPERSTPGG